MKTIREWFKTIQDEEVRERALKEMYKTCADKETETLATAIHIGLPCYLGFWSKIVIKSINGETI